MLVHVLLKWLVQMEADNPIEHIAVCCRNMSCDLPVVVAQLLHEVTYDNTEALCKNILGSFTAI